MEKQNDMLLRVKDLRVYYTAGGEIINAVNGVDLEVRRGETLGLVGETGAGKTTIAKSIMRILPDPPAKIGGGEISTWMARSCCTCRKRKCGRSGARRSP